MYSSSLSDGVLVYKIKEDTPNGFFNGESWWLADEISFLNYFLVLKLQYFPSSPSQNEIFYFDTRGLWRASKSINLT